MITDELVLHLKTVNNMSIFKNRKPSKQLVFDFDAEKKKAQLSFKFLTFLFTGRKKRKGQKSTDNKFFEH